MVSHLPPQLRALLEVEVNAMPRYALIPINELQEPPLPVRVSMDEERLNDLAASIRIMGVLQPPIVVPLTDAERLGWVMEQVHAAVPQSGVGPTFRIVAGHRRLMACRIAGLPEVPCMVYDDGALAEEAAMIAENANRENVTPAEEGLFFLEYVDKYKPLERDIPHIFGKSLNYIYERMAFARGPVEIVRANAERKINFGVAKMLMKVDDAGHRNFLLGHAIEGGATASVVQGWVVDWKKSQTFRSPEEIAAVVAVPVAHLPQAPQGCIFCGKADDPGNM